MDFIDRYRTRFRELPPRYKVAAVVSAMAWAGRTALWPIGGTDLYNEFRAIDNFCAAATYFNYAGLSNKAIAYGAAWIFLKAVQWGAVAYIGYGYYKAKRTAPDAP